MARARFRRIGSALPLRSPFLDADRPHSAAAVFTASRLSGGCHPSAPALITLRPTRTWGTSSPGWHGDDSFKLFRHILLTHHTPIRRFKGRESQGGLALPGIRIDPNHRTTNRCAALEPIRVAMEAQRPPRVPMKTTPGEISPPSTRGRPSEERGKETGGPSTRPASRQDGGYTRSLRGEWGSGSVLIRPVPSLFK
jgi:hypothetical protein